LRCALLLTLVVAAVAAGAAPAQAQVAVATAIAEDDVTQRDLASLVVQPARARWMMLTPQLEAAAVKTCPPGDTECLLRLAKNRGASHLLQVAVVKHGVRDHLLAVQLFSVEALEPLFEESARQPGADDARRSVRDVAARLLETAGPPAAPRVETAALAEPAPGPPVGPALLLGGAAVLGASWAVAFPAVLVDPGAGEAVALVGAVAGVGLALVGAGVTIAGAL
jgi:hypothetical protein